MRHLAVSGAHDPGILDLTNHFDGGSLDGVRAFDQAVRSVYAFRDENIEMIRDPRLMLADWETRGYLQGDCDDISTFSACVLTAMGVPCRFVAIRTDPSTFDYKHVFVEAWLTDPTIEKSSWYRVDATVSNATEMDYFGERMIQNI